VDQISWEIVPQFVREIVFRVDALFSYRTENCIPIRFAANRTAIRMGNRIRVDSPLARIVILPTIHFIETWSYFGICE
jgi:hypothetical protein